MKRQFWKIQYGSFRISSILVPDPQFPWNCEAFSIPLWTFFINRSHSSVLTEDLHALFQIPSWIVCTKVNVGGLGYFLKLTVFVIVDRLSWPSRVSLPSWSNTMISPQWIRSLPSRSVRSRRWSLILLLYFNFYYYWRNSNVTVTGWFICSGGNQGGNYLKWRSLCFFCTSLFCFLFEMTTRWGSDSKPPRQDDRTEGTDPGTWIDSCNGRTWGDQGRNQMFF